MSDNKNIKKYFQQASLKANISDIVLINKTYEQIFTKIFIK